MVGILGGSKCTLKHSYHLLRYELIYKIGQALDNNKQEILMESNIKGEAESTRMLEFSHSKKGKQGISLLYNVNEFIISGPHNQQKAMKNNIVYLST